MDMSRGYICRPGPQSISLGEARRARRLLPDDRCGMHDHEYTLLRLYPIPRNTTATRWSARTTWSGFSGPRTPCRWRTGDLERLERPPLSARQFHQSCLPVSQALSRSADNHPTLSPRLSLKGARFYGIPRFRRHVHRPSSATGPLEDPLGSNKVKRST